jgi:hypothetical protein
MIIAVIAGTADHILGVLIQFNELAVEHLRVVVIILWQQIRSLRYLATVLD